MSTSGDALQQGIMLSVRPRFSNALLSGSKAVELRRRPVRLSPGHLIALYEASPTKALAGFLIVADTFKSTPDAVWRRCNARMSLSRNEYDKYLHGAESAFAIEVKQAVRLETPLHLQRLRMQCPGFSPPQSFRYLDKLPAVLARLFREAFSTQVSSAKGTMTFKEA